MMWKLLISSAITAIGGSAILAHMAQAQAQCEEEAPAGGSGGETTAANDVGLPHRSPATRLRTGPRRHSSGGFEVNPCLPAPLTPAPPSPPVPCRRPPPPPVS
jgi:hypothetical protein